MNRNSPPLDIYGDLWHQDCPANSDDDTNHAPWWAKLFWVGRRKTPISKMIEIPHGLPELFRTLKCDGCGTRIHIDVEERRAESITVTPAHPHIIYANDDDLADAVVNDPDFPNWQPYKGYECAIEEAKLYVKILRKLGVLTVISNENT